MMYTVWSPRLKDQIKTFRSRNKALGYALNLAEDYGLAKFEYTTDNGRTHTVNITPE